jgi:hypothetical protein
MIRKTEEVDPNEIGGRDGRCVELAKDCVQLWAVLNPLCFGNSYLAT